MKNNIVLTIDKDRIKADLYSESRVRQSGYVPFDLLTEPKDQADAIYMELSLTSDSRIDCVVCPGGLLKPVRRGLYKVDDRVCNDILSKRYGEHPYNELTLICSQLAAKIGAKALMVNPLSCDELLPLNKVSSLAYIKKKSRYFACEHEALVTAAAEKLAVRPDETNVIAVWLDDIVSVGAHMCGICIEVNDALGGEGPMGFVSSGDVPVAQLAQCYFEGSDTAEELSKKLMTQGGALAYAGTDDPHELDSAVAKGNKEAILTLDAIAYQVAKWIGICALALNGKVDMIAIGGKGARCAALMQRLTKRVGTIAPVEIVQTLNLSVWLNDLVRSVGMQIITVNDY